MDIRLPNLLEWQRQCFAKAEGAFAAGEELFIVNVGRQAGKTAMLLIFLALWARGFLSGGHAAYCAPGKNHIEDVKDKAKRWMPEAISGVSPAGLGLEFVTGGRLDFWTLGAGAIAPLRGRTYDIVVVDEAAYVPDLLEILEGNIAPTLSTTGGPIILGSTPAGVNTDYHVMWRRTSERAKFSGPSALNPSISARYLARKRREYPELRYLQEHEAEFVDSAGAILKRSEIQAGKCPPLEEMESLCLGVDFALEAHKNADESAICLAGVDKGKRTWIIFVTSWRSTWPDTLAKTLDYIATFKPDVVCMEEVAFQTAVVHQLADCGVPIWPLKTNKSKTEKFGLVHCQYRLGRIFHSDTLSDDFTNQLLGFPEVEHDDMVDSLVQAVAGLNRGIREAWAESSSGSHWAPALPHEKKTKIFIGSVDQPIMTDETGPPSETVVLTPGIHESVSPIKVTHESGTFYRPAFTERLIGDEFEVIGNDGRILLRAHRSKMPLYLAIKAQNKLDWQQPGWQPKEEA
jgi:phage terminase large subunit-like protein